MWYTAAADLEQRIINLSLKTVLIAALVLVVFTIISARLKHMKRLKLPLFLVLSTTTVGATLILFTNTVYLNIKAESKGPVHWHSDIEFWACGSEIEPRDPTGFLSNKIGTATYHEHNDKRIHLEGVVVKKSEGASLEKFMRVVDGYATDRSIGIPLNESREEWLAPKDKQDGDAHQTDFLNSMDQYVKKSNKGPVLELANGVSSCGGTYAELQVFVYSLQTDDTYVQTKLADPSAYVMREESVVPPGDCVIVEFDRPKTTTDKLCLQYGVRDKDRCVEFGVEEYTPKLCKLQQITRGG